MLTESERAMRERLGIAQPEEVTMEELRKWLVEEENRIAMENEIIRDRCANNEPNCWDRGEAAAILELIEALAERNTP